MQVKTENDFRIIQESVLAQKIEHFTNLLSSAQPYRYVLRGIPCSMENEEIKIALESEGFTTSKISRLRKKDGSPMPHVLVQLPKSENNKKIFSITHLSNLIISVEKQKKKKGPSQCWNCQSWKHSSSTCFNSPKCLKCAGDHRTFDCVTKNWGSKVKCVNCGKGHPANFGGCEKTPENQ